MALEDLADLAKKSVSDRCISNPLECLIVL